MDARFVGRLKSVIDPFGSAAAFARKAGVPLSSVQAYLKGHEPTRPVLVLIAQTAGVSVDWLASGEGTKAPGDAPEGYFRVPCHDLSEQGPYLVGMLREPPFSRLFKLSDFPRWIRAVPLVRAIEGCEGLSFQPLISSGDVFIYEWFIGAPERWPVAKWPLGRHPDDVYLVADGIDLRICKLRRRADAILVLNDRNETTQTLKGEPHDFFLFGRIVWRGGSLPAAWTHPILGRDESPRRARG